MLVTNRKDGHIPSSPSVLCGYTGPGSASMSYEVEALMEGAKGSRFDRQ
jgi:hypothetical protein